MPAPSKPRVFLDSNVVFSGLYSSQGAPGKILEHFVAGRLMAVVSQQVLDEVVRTMRDKLPGALPTLRKLLVSVPPQVVKDPSPDEVAGWLGILEPGDASILVAAVGAQPDYFVTGDKHILDNAKVAEKSRLKIVTPAQLLEALGAG